MNVNATTLPVQAALSATIIRADGSHRDCGVIASNLVEVTPLRKLWRLAKKYGRIPATMGLFAFVAYLFSHPEQGVLLGLVTNGSADYLASIMAGTTPAVEYKYVGVGTDATAEAASQGALIAPVAGLARVAGTLGKVSQASFGVSARVDFSGLPGETQIREWGLFSEATNGNMWDRRVHGIISVSNGDSINYNYQCLVPSGGN